MSRSLPLLLSLCFAGACSTESAPERRDAEPTKRLEPSEAIQQPRPRRLRPPPKLNTKRPPFAISASHILIQFKGATKATTKRSKAEAHRIAAKVLAEAKGGAPFHELAQAYSDSPDKAGGGYIGIFQPWKRYPQFNEAVASVGFEEIVPNLVETDLGLHIVKREKTLHLGHVLVMHKESRTAHTEIKRTREEARVEAQRLHGLLTAQGADWAAVAQEFSDCPLTKAIGGDLGYYGKGAKSIAGGRLLPKLIPAVMGLGPGDVSEVTETEFGFHVVWRYPDPQRGELGTPNEGPDAGADTAVEGVDGAVETP